MAPDRRPPEAADLERVVGVFDGLMHRLMATHAPELNTFEMTMSQTKAMYLVLASGPMRMSELAHRLGVTNSTATGQVDRVVELGSLARPEDPADFPNWCRVHLHGRAGCHRCPASSAWPGSRSRAADASSRSSG